MVHPLVLETRRRFIPFVVWSSRIVDFWNSAVRLKSSIRRARSEEARDREDEFRFFVDSYRTSKDLTCDSIRRARWENVEVDPAELVRGETRAFIPYALYEDITFDTVCANINLLLDDCIEELEAKIVVIPPIPPEWELIGEESDTGFNVYYNPTEDEYVELEESEESPDWIKDSTSLKETRREEYLEITVTASLETGVGHEPFVAEITCSTRVKSMGRSGIDEVEKEMLEHMNISREDGFEQVESDIIKIGVEYRMDGFKPIYPRLELISEKKVKTERKYPQREETLRKYLR